MTQTQVNFHIHTQAEAASNFYAKIAILETTLLAAPNDIMNAINWNSLIDWILSKMELNYQSLELNLILQYTLEYVINVHNGKLFFIWLAKEGQIDVVQPLQGF